MQRNLIPKEATDEEEDVEVDALELLFSQLEEDLKNDAPTLDDGEEDEFSEEDLARLERELGLALGIDVDDDEEQEAGEEDDDEEVLEDTEEEEMPVKLKNWQLRRLASALKKGRRKTSVSFSIIESFMQYQSPVVLVEIDLETREHKIFLYESCLEKGAL